MSKKPSTLAKAKEMLEVQGRDGNWNYDPYMHGLYNGMEYVIALFDGEREPNFKQAPDKWLEDTVSPERKRVLFIQDLQDGLTHKETE